jgi:hypothetical protein
MPCAENPGATVAEPFHVAETFLHKCLARAQGKENWQLYPYEAAQLAPLLTLHDEQLATCRGEHYHDAWYPLAAAAKAAYRDLRRSFGVRGRAAGGVRRMRSHFCTR